MVVAKTDRAHKSLSEAFADHGRTGDLERAYDALVWGIPQRLTGTIDAPLGRAADRIRRAVVPEHREDARHAITHYAVQERFGEGQDQFATASLVECRLETGRTHQIRVHMAHIGHPVVGDPDYGPGLPHQGQPPARAAEIGRPGASRARPCTPGCLHFATRLPMT